jgi:VanZ family protein
LIEVRFAALPRWIRDFVPLVIWMALIFLLSSRSTLLEIESQLGDKLVFKSSHIVAYAVLTWLCWRALSSARHTDWPLLATAFALAVLYGISDEIHQLFVPGRHGRLADVFFDAGGALLMILLLRWLAWLRRFPESLALSLGPKG